MGPNEFVTKWAANMRSEQAASKEHFVDLCALLVVPTPNSDPTGATYAFEKGVVKSTGTGGWADVWKKGCFGWEYKSRGGDLDKAHDQLLRYGGALENPPLLVTSDMDRIIVRTNFNGMVSERVPLALDQMRDPTVRNRLRACWLDPGKWTPGTTRAALTELAAAEFAGLAQRLRTRGHDPQVVAHFVNRMVFCLFADNVGLLPDGVLGGLLAFAARSPMTFQAAASELFAAMRAKGGRIGYVPVQWFNGGLFDDDVTLPLEVADIAALTKASALNWSEIDPSIFGTLFERGLDPDKRSQLGAHYTDRGKIELLVNAVVVDPLLEEWSLAKARVSDAMNARALLALAAKSESEADALVIAGSQAVTKASTKARENLRKAAERRRRKMAALMSEAQVAYQEFVDRLRSFRVLDPACGSGNFLYVSLIALKDLELRIDVEAEAIGLAPLLPAIGPEAVLGIEINRYAAELARVSDWIGHIQWARRNGYPLPSDPVLQSLDTIDCRDAVLGDDGAAAGWPEVNCIVGNPPFLGDKEMGGRLGQAYVQRLRRAYAGRVPGGADFVCYWFEQGRGALASGRAERVGLVATNSIRDGANRRVVSRIREGGVIYDAWSNEEWTLDGAAVRVSLICFTRSVAGLPRLNGREVDQIYANLRAGIADLTLARPLPQNERKAFSGITKKGAFNIPGDLARSWLLEPANPNGRSNSEVLSPWMNGEALTDRSSDMWIINFGEKSLQEAVYFNSPFAHVEASVKPVRSVSAAASERREWWKLARRAPAMFDALRGLGRFIITPEVSKHRIFAWCPVGIVPDKNLVVVARDDDTTLGILQSRFHTEWSLRVGSSLEDRPRYTSTTTFRTFPFPVGMTPDIPANNFATDAAATRIAVAARELVDQRERWLNPPEWTVSMPEVVAGYPDRQVANDSSTAQLLRARTMTNLYNLRGTAKGAWLDNLHAVLDAAVAEAYGWGGDINDEDAMEMLLTLNLDRSEPTHIVVEMASDEFATASGTA